jgi:Zn-dependent peptidase ImmA (M78 family)
VKVSFVTEPYLRKISKAYRDEVVMGLYMPSKNTIFILKDMDEHQTKHTLFHELKHAFDDQCQGLDEEANCNAFAALMLRLKVEVKFCEPDN